MEPELKIKLTQILKDAEGIAFPDPETSDKQGLLAMGGDLSPSRLLKAYSMGIFPWFEPGCPILWWCPNPRLILYPKQFKISHSLKKTLKKNYRLTIDTAFDQVITACASVGKRVNNTWITPDMIAAYKALHQLGYAHSFEVWDKESLIGGLYGVSLGHAFFGESMFHYETNASKVAMHYLCQTMSDWDYHFVDCQLPTAHLISLGSVVISRKEYLFRLHEALQEETQVGTWINTQNQQD